MKEGQTTERDSRVVVFTRMKRRCDTSKNVTENKNAIAKKLKKSMCNIEDIDCKIKTKNNNSRSNPTKKAETNRNNFWTKNETKQGNDFQKDLKT